MAEYLTQAEVHATADGIDAAGEKPTISAVYKILKRGSNSTIQRHLGSWKPREQIETLPAMPDSLQAAVSLMVGDLWCVAVRAADERGARAISEANAATLEAQSTAADLGALADKLKAELAIAEGKVESLNIVVGEREQQILQFQDYTQHQETNIAKRDGEIEALRRTITDLMQATKRFQKDA